MKKVLIIAILALNVVSLSYLSLSQSNSTFTINSAIAEEDETRYYCDIDNFSVTIPIDCYDSSGNHHTEGIVNYHEVYCWEDPDGVDYDPSCLAWWALDPCTEEFEEGGDCPLGS